MTKAPVCKAESEPVPDDEIVKAFELKKGELVVLDQGEEGRDDQLAGPEADEEPTDLLAALRASVEAAKRSGGSTRTKRPPARKPAARRKKSAKR